MKDKNFFLELKSLWIQVLAVIWEYIFREGAYFNYRFKHVYSKFYLFFFILVDFGSDMLMYNILFTQMYEITEEGGILKTLNEIWCKLTKPLQPQVPQQENTNMKSLSYPFSREKIYL